MKWSIVLLSVLGVVAALCAAVFVVAIQGGSKTAGGPVANHGEAGETSFLVASRDLEAFKVVETDAVEIRPCSSKEAPANSFSQPAAVIGQVLRKPMKKGELFDPACFTSAEGMGVKLAGTLREGKRAVSIPLTESGGIEGLLYPGCMVDVLASIQLKDDEGLGDQPMSMTLLQGIYVLGVGDQTVVSATGGEEFKGKPSPSTVTLLVDTKQAEMLYLARQRGSVSIALRNPMDVAAVGTQGTRLPNLSPAFAEVEGRATKRFLERQKEADREFERQRTKAAYDMERAQYDIERTRKEAEIFKIELDRKKLETERNAAQTVKPQWETRIVRGGVEEIKKFDLPERKPDH
jgi:pilus assembly protein CpaB